MLQNEEINLLNKTEEIEEKLVPYFKAVEKIAFTNQKKVLAAFRETSSE